MFQLRLKNDVTCTEITSECFILIENIEKEYTLKPMIKHLTRRYI